MLHVLVVCTANVCRSPVAARLLQRELDAAGVAAVVSSAGTHGGRLRVHRYTRSAAGRAGVDLRDHRSRALTRPMLDREGSDLIVTMTREHLYEVVALDREAFRRTFTLRELARRVASPGHAGGPSPVGSAEPEPSEAGAVDLPVDTAVRVRRVREVARRLIGRADRVEPPVMEEVAALESPGNDAFDTWLATISAGRTSADLLPGRIDDDLEDPYGSPRPEHVAMVADVADLTARVATAIAAALASDGTDPTSAS